MSQSVVTTVATRLADTQLAEWYVQVVHQHQQVLHRHFLLLQPVPHRIAAQVHIRRGLQQHQQGRLHAARSYHAVPAVLPGRTDALGKGVDDVKTDIVTRMLILVTYIAQSYYQILSHLRFVLCLFTNNGREKPCR